MARWPSMYQQFVLKRVRFPINLSSESWLRPFSVVAKHQVEHFGLGGLETFGLIGNENTFVGSEPIR